jgi:hypothetical protein
LMQKDSNTMKTITVLALVFLPTSTIAVRSSLAPLLLPF